MIPFDAKLIYRLAVALLTVEEGGAERVLAAIEAGALTVDEAIELLDEHRALRGYSDGASSGLA